MSKFFLTNNIDWYNKTKERIFNSDFSLAFDYAEDGVYALTTHKLRIKNTNAYLNKDNNFVIATGTAIYKESLDYSSIISDFKSIGIDGIRSNTIGQYAYIVKDAGLINVFGDPVGTYNIYYYCRGEAYFVSNFLYDLAFVLRDRISLNEMNVMENAIRRSILGNETFFNEIMRLGGDEVLSIRDGVFNLIEIPNKWPLKTDILIGDIARDMANKMSSKARVISSVLGAPNICMTGGLDSRMSLSAYLNIGVKPTLSFGVSNTYIAFPESKDSDVVKAIADKFSLNLHLMQWNTKYPDISWDKYLQRYGFLYHLWGACECVVDFFENQEERICTQGYFGELYRNLTFIEGRKENLSMEEFLNFYFTQEGYSGIDKERINDHIMRKLNKIAEKYHIDKQHISSEDVFYFYLEYRKVADSVTMNYVNLIRYSELLLMEYDILEYAHVSSRLMDNSQLMLYVMNILYPHVLNVPIFTHQQLTRFDPSDMRLYVGKDIYRSRVILRLKSLYHRMSFLKPLRELYVKAEEHSSKKENVKKTGYDDSMAYYSDNWQSLLTHDFKMYNMPNRQLYHVMEKKAIASIIK